MTINTGINIHGSSCAVIPIPCIPSDHGTTTIIKPNEISQIDTANNMKKTNGRKAKRINDPSIIAPAIINVVPVEDGASSACENYKVLR